MRDFNLAYYLEDFRRLGELDEKELQNLLSQYPYAQNLHLLKSKWDWVHKHLFSESNAIYATQRERYFQQIEHEVWEQFPVKTLSIPSTAAVSEAPVFEEIIPADTGENPPSPAVLEVIPEEKITEVPAVVDETTHDIPPTLDTWPDQMTTSTEAMPTITEGPALMVDPTLELFAEEIPAHPAGAEEENIEAVSGEPVAAEEPGDEQISLKTWEETNRPEEVERPVPQPDPVWDLLEESWMEDALNHAANENDALLERPIIDPDLPGTNNPFSQWLRRLSPMTPGLLMTPPKPSSWVETEPPATEPLGAQPLKDAAAASNIMRDHIASETLADLLARQGYKERAISIYEKLILTNPEKSNFFAEKIKKLKGS